MCSLSNASWDVVLVEKVVHECEEILLNLIRKLSIPYLRRVYDKTIAVVRSPLLKMNGTPWRTTTLRVLDVVEHNFSTRLKIRVWIQSLSRFFTLSSISLPSLREGLLLELLRFLDRLQNIISTDDKSASHMCPFYKRGTPGPFYRPRGIKISLAASPE